MTPTSRLRDRLGRLGIVAYERVAEDVRHGVRDFVRAADVVQREAGFALYETRGGLEFLNAGVSAEYMRESLTKRTDLGGHPERVDLAQRYDRNASLHAAVLKQVLADLLVLDNDIVQPYAGADLERGGFRELGRVESDEGSDKALHLRVVEVGVGGGVAEV